MALLRSRKVSHHATRKGLTGKARKDYIGASYEHARGNRRKPRTGKGGRRPPILPKRGQRRWTFGRS